ncbi:MAG: carboxypeptidase regulatory-like domain-containing protein, partial [Terriglobia bacterium]
MRQLIFRILIVMTVAPMVMAQIVDTGTISGVVRDNTGGVIPRAQVTLLDIDTGLSQKTATNVHGLYVSPPLPAGNYEVEVEAHGFAKAAEHIRLDVAQRVEVDVVLSVGSTMQSVTVKGASVLLGTETSTLSNLRTATAIKNLPLNGRNFSKLMDLAAGVMPAQSELRGNLPIAEARGPTANSVNGLRYQENNFLLDGIYDNDNHNGYGIIIYPPLDAIEEFREETSVADARYGRGGGGTVNLIYKSGTKNFHGDLFEFLRNSGMDARNFFDQSIPELRMNQFGGTLGGPLTARKSPKTFFFIDYQGTRLRRGLTFVRTVPIAAFRLGDFSAEPHKIFDPLTQVPTSKGGFSRKQFTGNVIPSTHIDPVGAKLISLYPAPNLPGIVNNFLFNPVLSKTEDKGDVKVNHRFSESDGGFVRYSHARNDIFTPGPLPAPAVGGGGPTGLTRDPSSQVLLSETHLISPTSINETRFGLSRISSRTFNIDYGQDLASAVGIPGVNIPGEKLTSGLPLISIGGAAQLGGSGLNPAILVSTDFEVDDALTIIRGRHTLQFGGQLLRLQYNAFQTGDERGTMAFDAGYTLNPGSPAGTGFGVADLLLGRPGSGSLKFMDGPRGFRQAGVASYVQDTFKAANKLTLNLGMRYEDFLGCILDP